MLSSRSPAREATVLLRSPCLRGDGGRSRPAVDAYLGRTLHVARRSAAGGGGGGPLPDWLLGLAVEEVGRRSFAGMSSRSHGLHVREGLELLRTALDELRGTSFVPYYPVMLGALAQGLAQAGYVAQALATIDEALAKCERDEERWWIAELLRIKAEVKWSAEGADAAAAAEAHLQDALSWTRRQGALSLELRCATDLARLWQQQGRSAPARDLVAAIYARFTEGFATADLEAAKALLGSLGVT